MLKLRVGRNLRHGRTLVCDWPTYPDTNRRTRREPRAGCLDRIILALSGRGGFIDKLFNARGTDAESWWRIAPSLPREFNVTLRGYLSSRQNRWRTETGWRSRS